MRKALSYSHLTTPNRPRCDMCPATKKHRTHSAIWLAPVGNSLVDSGMNLCKQHSKNYNYAIQN